MYLVMIGDLEVATIALRSVQFCSAIGDATTIARLAICVEQARICVRIGWDWERCRLKVTTLPARLPVVLSMVSIQAECCD